MILETLRPNLFSIIANRIIFKAKDSICTPNNNASVRISEELFKQKQTDLETLRDIFSETFDREKIKVRREKATKPTKVPDSTVASSSLDSKTSVDLSHLNEDVDRRKRNKSKFDKTAIKDSLDLEPEPPKKSSRQFF